MSIAQLLSGGRQPITDVPACYRPYYTNWSPVPAVHNIKVILNPERKDRLFRNKHQLPVFDQIHIQNVVPVVQHISWDCTVEKIGAAFKMTPIELLLEKTAGRKDRLVILIEALQKDANVARFVYLKLTTDGK